ncbi:MAG: P-II family nitrogen regulator [Deltaproteobacteria bacterium]|nr:P-II family nitrogen regulator [Deltaproteobacteria bacterium]
MCRSGLIKARLEIGVPDDKAGVVVEAVPVGAKTGRAGDGVIFVPDALRGMRIRAGETMWSPGGRGSEGSGPRLV